MKAILNHIIFQFNEEVDAKGFFKKKTDWGLEIRGHVDDSAKSPRWVTVVKAGPECKFVQPGDQILVKPLMWSVRFTYEGQQYWRTDETKLVAKQNAEGFKALNTSVIFVRKDKKVQTQSGIEVVGRLATDTPTGEVVELGPDVKEQLLNKSTVYFFDENFFNYFDYRNVKFCYLDEMEIVAYIPKE